MAKKNSIPQFVNSESIMSDSNYVKWLSDLKGRIRIAQLKAAIKVNEELHKLYWSLGEDICNKQKLYKWGTNFIKQLSLDLRSAFPNVEVFLGQIFIKYASGISSILRKINFCTKLVQN